jgi:hypothetical protein
MKRELGPRQLAAILMLRTMTRWSYGCGAKLPGETERQTEIVLEGLVKRGLVRKYRSRYTSSGFAYDVFVLDDDDATPREMTGGFTRDPELG